MKSKPRNERLSNAKVRKQQHLLEVSVRRDKAVSMRNRAIFSFVCKTIIFAALGVGAWIGGKELLRRFLWENPDYLLAEVRVATDGTLTREQYLSAVAYILKLNGLPAGPTPLASDSVALSAITLDLPSSH